MAGLSIPIKLTEQFSICPELMYYDWSGGYLSRTLMEDYAGYLPPISLRKENKGEEIVAGVQTRLEF